MLRSHRGRLRVWGTPWHGSGRHALPRSAPVEAVFFLRASRRTTTRRLSRPDAAACLLARSFPPPWDGPAIARALAFCGRAARAVPCFELRFRPDRTALRAVETVLAPDPFRRKHP